MRTQPSFKARGEWWGNASPLVPMRVSIFAVFSFSRNKLPTIQATLQSSTAFYHGDSVLKKKGGKLITSKCITMLYDALRGGSLIALFLTIKSGLVLWQYILMHVQNGWQCHAPPIPPPLPKLNLPTPQCSLFLFRQHSYLYSYKWLVRDLKTNIHYIWIVGGSCQNIQQKKDI